MAAILRLRGPPYIGHSRRPGAFEALPADAERLSAVETRVRPRTMTHREPTARRSPRPGRRTHASRGVRAGRSPDLGPRRHAVGARGHAGGRPTASAGWTSRSACAPEVEDLEAFGAEVRDAGITDAVLLGMGGSSLGPEVLRRSFGDGAIRLHVLDSTHPDQIRATRDALDLDTDAVHRLLEVRRDDRDDVAVQVLPLAAVATARTTSPSPTRARSLAQLGAEHGFRRVFENDPDIGGRYSVLSYFGLVPGRDRRLRRRRRARGHRAGGDGGLPGRAGQPRPEARRSRSASWRSAAATS